MKKEKRNVGIILLLSLVVIVLLVIIILIFNGVIRINSNDEITEKNGNDTTEINDTSFSEDYTYADIKGVYEYTAKETEEGYIPVHSIYLYENGQFYYQVPVRSEYGFMGNYAISDNKITLTYWLKFSGGIQNLGDSDLKTNVLTINSDGSLTDLNPVFGWYDEKEITLVKASNSDFDLNSNRISDILSNYVQ